MTIVTAEKQETEKSVRRASTSQVEGYINKGITTSLSGILPQKKKKQTKEMTEEINFLHTLDHELRSTVGTLQKYATNWKTDTIALTHNMCPDIMKALTKILMTNDYEMDVPYFETFNDIIGRRDTTEKLNKSLDADNILPKRLHIISNMPKMKTCDLLSITDQLGLILIPLSYLNKDSYKLGNNYTRNIKDYVDIFRSSIEGFNGLYPYVVCPIKHYSFFNHLESVVDLPIYTKDYASQFITLSMQIPTLKGMKMQIKDIETRVGSLENGYVNLDNSIKGLTTQLTRLEQIVKNQQHQIVSANESIMTLAKNNESLSSRLAVVEEICATDPIVVALSKKVVDSNFTNGLDDTCIIGPCWGPEFQMFSILANKMELFINQQKLFDTIMVKNLTTYSLYEC